ncbi:hypothetical protein ACH4C6_07560 [Streptomyces sp. NPDC017943]|uniref:hypothetical protein n=1 Tax=Streptomyces sp. NPDC017943 TaxID=3365019 RepID=UPI00378E4764
MPLHTTPHKALAQLLRRDQDGVARYRAELKYFHVPQRAILGMTNAYQVLDEGFTLVDDPVLRQAAVYGPEFVDEMLGMRQAMRDVSQKLLTEAGVPQPLRPTPTPPQAHPHALPPP